MLTFEEYDETIDDLERKLKVLERRINYREIQLVGTKKDVETATVTTTGGFISATCSGLTVNNGEDPLKADLELQKLYFKKQRLEEELRFVKRTAELPE